MMDDLRKQDPPGVELRLGSMSFQSRKLKLSCLVAGALLRSMVASIFLGFYATVIAYQLMVVAMLVLLCTRPPEAAMFGQLPWLLTVPSIAIISRESEASFVNIGVAWRPHLQLRCEEFRKTFKKENPTVKVVSSVGKAGREKWKSLSAAPSALTRLTPISFRFSSLSLSLSLLLGFSIQLFQPSTITWDRLLLSR
ncbi:hypothetical protein L6452_32626 [Arctium lappa]|uniref:Uncharacterized protein n=1 Tax=Arctium lappa TaxID=4217 RepID=A0ACB8Z5B9_ARCLA|nr:hypothetical protein L6452_32626 [Arctium lappa]